MWYVYVLKSLKRENWHYVGSTNDMERRLKQHESGHTPSTKKYRPLELIHNEEYETEPAARKREWFLKHPKGYLDKKKIIAECARSSAG